MSAGVPRVVFRLVTPRIATFDRGVPCRSVTRRSMRKTCLTCGNGRPGGAGMTCRVRVSTLPCPRLVVVWLIAVVCQVLHFKIFVTGGVVGR